jgi:predicted ATPase
MSHLIKGLELLKTLPDTPERVQQELDLQIILGPVLMVLKGLADPEVERVYTRARALCQRVGETPQLFTILVGLRNVYIGRGKHQTARELGEQLLGLAQRVQDPALLLEAHLYLGQSLFYLGELIAARMHLQQSIALYDPRQHHSNAVICSGSDPGVNGLCNEALALWSLGYPDQALKRSHAGLTLAQELSHPASLAVALAFAALLHQLRGEIQATQRQTEEMIALSREQGYLPWPPLGTVMQGWVLAERGQIEEGIAKLRQGVAAFRATGAEVGLPYYLALLALAYAKAGRAEEGLAVLAEAMDLVHRNGERLSEPGLYVLKGWLLLARSGDNQAEAESCFRHAIDIARRQSAKSSELRAVMGLSFLLQSQGKKEEARQMLAEIYGWFTEGFDTKNLQEAKALLEKLT